MFFFFKQETAYEMRISDWSSDVCSSDLLRPFRITGAREYGPGLRDRIDAALLLFGRAPGPAVIVECAQIPFAVPCGSFDRGRERVGAPIPAITKPGLIFVETVPREISDGRADKPGKPHAFTVSSAADPIHDVIDRKSTRLNSSH